MKKPTLIRYFLRVRKYLLKEISPVFLGLLSGVSVFYFLFFLDAYGIKKGTSYSGHSHLFRASSFGILTFMYLSIFEIWVKPKKYIRKLKHIVIWYLVLVIIGSQFIYILFNYFWNWQEWNLDAYLLIMKEFPLMMIIPFLFYAVFRKINTSKNIEESYLIFQSINGKDTLKIKQKSFLYARSSENYISITYIVNDHIKEHLIRKPLKVLEEELKTYPEIQKSHRSYLVNKSNIQSVKQVKDKVCISVKGYSIPVSKKYHKQFIN